MELRLGLGCATPRTSPTSSVLPVQLWAWKGTAFPRKRFSLRTLMAPQCVDFSHLNNKWFIKE